jgi:hypothetical protein
MPLAKDVKKLKEFEINDLESCFQTLQLKLWKTPAQKIKMYKRYVGGLENMLDIFNGRRKFEVASIRLDQLGHAKFEDLNEDERERNIENFNLYSNN